MNITIVPGRGLSGEVTAPPSKARTHRALVAGLLSKGTTTIENPLSCDDTKNTFHAIVALGAKAERSASGWIVEGSGHPSIPDHEIYCGESGATLRFLAPIAALTGGKVAFTGKPSLLRRPIEPLEEAMQEIGVETKLHNDRLIVDGKPSRAVVHIRGDVSSQFISGLLFAGPLMTRGLRIELTSAIESSNYLSLTLNMMKQHGVDVVTNREMSFFEIGTGQRYIPAQHRVLGDYSSAAFMLAAAAITRSTVFVRGLPRNDLEPDALVVELLSKMGNRISITDEGVQVAIGTNLKATRANLRDNPDLGPILAVLGCYAEGETRIEGAARLRYKESDRLTTISTALTSLGADISQAEDTLTIRGPSALNGGTVSSYGDHRIAMALSVAALQAKGEVEIKGVECVSKSYPTFFDDLRSLGAEVVE